MKNLRICTYASGTTYYSLNDAMVDAAYEKIKAAMVAYKEYGNDKESVVTVEWETGEKTFRLRDMFTAEITAMGDTEDAVILALNARDARLKKMADAAEAASNPDKAAAPAAS